MNRDENDQDGVESSWDDEEERRALERIIHAFRCYAQEGRHEVRRWERQYASLSDAHRRILSTVPVKCQRAVELLERNQFFLNMMLGEAEVPLGDGAATVREGEMTRPTPSDVEKVRYVLKNLVRDWGGEGGEEREATYSLILQELRERFPDRTTTRPKVLVPGCGLARLVVEIGAAGFETEGNEFSYFMLLPASFMLNRSAGVDAWTIYPWVLSTCNQLSDDDQLREASLPDVDAAEMMHESGGTISMVAGDFVEVYRRPESQGSFDCVVTSFFIDTAHNVVEYLEIIYGVLKPGGLWVNLGPLLYHWVDSSDPSDLSIEISLEEVERIAKEIGFIILSKKSIQAPYLANSRAMFETVYKAVFWTMQKGSEELAGLGRCTEQ